jgi:hypothetical protein
MARAPHGWWPRDASNLSQAPIHAELCACNEAALVAGEKKCCSRYLLWSTETAQGDPPSFQWTPMLVFRSWRGVSDEREASVFPETFQTRSG